MRKVVSSKQILASTALAASLAIFGCSTNKMPGDGEPSSMPLHSPATAAPTNGTSGGTRPGTSGGIAPMISSGPASMTTPAVDAYAQVAQAQGFRGRILGPSFPGQSDIAATMQPTGQFQNPSLVANPEVTVNRSASSDATPAIINDSDTGITIVNSAGTTSGVTAAATVAPVTTAAASSGTPTLTQSSVGVPSPTITAAPATQTRAVGSLNLPSMISSSSSNASGLRVTTTSAGTPLITNVTSK